MQKKETKTIVKKAKKQKTEIHNFADIGNNGAIQLKKGTVRFIVGVAPADGLQIGRTNQIYRH